MSNVVENFLAHYGVKGMEWGQRKAAIKSARSDVGRHERKVITAEQEYLKARESGNAKRTATKEQDLKKVWTDREVNRLTASTLTRGEQLLIGAMSLPYLAGHTYATREGQKIKDYPMRVLNNAHSDEYNNN